MTERPGGRIETIDVLRGAAALMVTWWHVFDRDVRYLENDTLHALASTTAGGGNVGVYMFFAISGFVIPLAAVGGGRDVAYGPAIAKRMVRLYPPFFLSIALSVALLFAAPWIPGFAGAAPVLPWQAVVANATYLAPFVGVDWINPVYWTLLVEVQYYILIYALLVNLHRISAPALVAGGLVAALLPLGFATQAWIVDFTECFAVGFMAFLVHDRRIDRRAALVVAAAALVVAGVDKGWFAAAMVAITAALCLAGGRAPRWLVGLGTISYSLYLVHYVLGTKAFRLFRRFVPADDAGTLLAYALAMTACVVAAIAFYHLAEKPAIGWSHWISARRRTAARVAASDI